MPSLVFPAPLLDRLRARFEEVGFAERPLLELTGVDSLLSVPASRQREVLASLASAGTLGGVASLFWLCRSAPRGGAEQALGRELLDQGLDAGLFEEQAGRVRSTVLVLPWSGHLVVSDRPEHQGATDHVMSVGRGTEVLRAILIRKPVERALDLGSGSGAISLEMAGFAKHVDGIELNPRALDHAHNTARLNDDDRCSFIRGDFFKLEEALGDRRYGLIAAQPPLLMGPTEGLMYRDVAGEGDSAMWQLVREVADRLAPGGFGQVVLGWLERRGEDAQQRIRDELESLDCDVLLAQSDREPPLQYAQRWLASAGHAPEEQQRQLADYAAYYDRLSVEAVASGLVVLRKRASGTPWRHFTELPEGTTASAGEHLQQMFDGLDFVEGKSDDELLAARLCVPAAIRLEQALVPTPRGWRPDDCATKRTDGILYVVNHDIATFEMVIACNGERTLSEVVDHMAQRFGDGREAITQMVLPVARTYLSHGLLLPAPAKG